MPKAIRLELVRNERKKKAAKSLRGEMFGELRHICKDVGDSLAGYAIVVWTEDGSTQTNLRSGGPVKGRSVPRHAHDALNQHVAADMGKES